MQLDLSYILNIVSQAEDRKYKSWVTGSAGTAGMSSDLDAMQVHFLSERALCVHGANNFV